MAERFPGPPMVEEDGISQESSSPEPQEENTVQPLRLDDSWLPLYKEKRFKEVVDFIVAFVSSPQKDTEQTRRFLKCVWVLCERAKVLGLTQGLETFCHWYRVVENIKEVLEEEPLHQLQTEVRQLAMLAIAKLSSVGLVLEGKEERLLQACFSSVFWLLPEEKIRDLSPCLYFRTLEAMDTMLEALVLNCPAPRVSELLQNIFQLLISFSDSSVPADRKRAVGRMRVLSCFLTKYSSGNDAAPNEESSASSRDFEIPNLGQLLGQLLLLLSCKEENEETSNEAWEALRALYQWMQQKLTALPEDHGKLQENWEAQTAPLSCLERARHIIEISAKHLQPSQRTDFSLRIIEGLSDLCVYKKQLVRSVLDGLLAEPDLWLVDIPKIISCIYQKLRFFLTDSTRQGMRSLLLKVVEKSPGEAVTALLDKAPAGDSRGLAVWELMFSMPQLLEVVLPQLLKQLQQRKQKMLLDTLPEDTSCLALLASILLPEEHFARTYQFWRFLRHQSQAMLSLVLSGVATLSESPEMARKMKVLLPDLLEVLQQGSGDVAQKAAIIFRNVMPELKREEASPMAVELLDELLPLFDSDSWSELREISIGLFTELLKKMVAGKSKRQLENKVRQGLLPLFFCLSDDSQSVAEASRQALLAAAELLRWKQLRHLVQTRQTWRIGECLVLQDRSRAAEYLEQSLEYLDSAQAGVRREAIRLIGLAARGQSREKLSEMISELELLENDCSPSVQCLATQTKYILSCLRVKAKPGSPK